MSAVHLVVRAHNCTDMTILHGNLEWKRVDLLQGPFVELYVDLEPVLLLCIHIVVFGGGDDRIALDALDVASRHLSRKPRILPKRLEQTTERWNARDIQPWTKQDIESRRPRLPAQHVHILYSRC